MKKLRLIVFLFLCLMCFGYMNVSAITTLDLDNEFAKISSDGTLDITIYEKPKTCSDAEFIMSSVINKKVDLTKYSSYAYCRDMDYQGNGDVSKLTVYISDIRKEGENEDPLYKEYSLNVNYNIVDESVSQEISSIVKSIEIPYDPNSNEEAPDGYFVTDLYLLNYYYVSTQSKVIDNIRLAPSLEFKFSKEVNEKTKGANLTYDVDIRAGDRDDTNLWSKFIGETIVYYNDNPLDVIHTGLESRNYLYVDEDAPNKLEYIQKRINDYFKTDDITVTVGGLLTDLNYQENEWDFTVVPPVCVPKSELTYWNDRQMFDESKLADNNYYVVKMNGYEFNFVLYKGTEDELNDIPNYISTDSFSKVTITSESSSIPLDTLVNATISDDENLEKVIKNPHVAYDISLYSQAAKKSITKLENGKFLVSIPIPNVLDGKELIVYYVNNNNELEEHEVTIKDGIATFETNHFSTYALAEKINNSEGSPETLDNISSYLIIGLVGLISLSVCIIYLNKKHN